MEDAARRAFPFWRGSRFFPVKDEDSEGGLCNGEQNASSVHADVHSALYDTEQYVCIERSAREYLILLKFDCKSSHIGESAGASTMFSAGRHATNLVTSFP